MEPKLSIDIGHRSAHCRARTLSSAVWLAVLVFVSGCSSPQASQPEPAVPVVIERASERKLPASMKLLGVVEPIRTVEVRAQIDGLVAAAYIDDGAEVIRGQKLFEIDPRSAQVELARSRSDLTMHRAEYRRLAAQLDRYEKMAESNFVSSADLQRHRSEMEVAAAMVQRSEADMMAARLQLERTTIYAPIDGRAGKLRARVGDRIEADDDAALVTLRQIAPINVGFSVSGLDFAALRPAIQSDALGLRIEGRGLAAPIDADFAFMDNQVDPSNGMVRLRARVRNADARLWPGQFVDVVVSHGEETMVAVPEAAIKAGPQGDYVYIVDARSRARMRPVKVARRAEGLAVIARGLSDGEKVVTDGHSRLRDGAAIEPAAATR
jgi:membrane fusion protein, multidrug efflux system